MKNVRNVKNSLKFKAQVKPGALSVKIGVKKYNVPVDARILSSGEYLFLSFPACSELFEIKNKQLEAMPGEADAADAFIALNPTRKRGRKRSSKAELPDDLANALRNIPEGYKLGYDAGRNFRLVKKRTRNKKG